MVAAALAVGACFAIAGCEKKPPVLGSVNQPGEALRVVVTIPPIAGIVEPMAKDSGLTYRIDTLIPPGVSEHGYEIDPSKLVALAKADLVVMVGLGLEPQVDKFLKEHPSEKRRVIVCADYAGIPASAGAGATHDAHGDHDHHGVDPHIWLDPVMVGHIVAQLGDALRNSADQDAMKKIDHAETDMAGRVQDVHKEYQATLAKASRRTIIVAHDAYGYLAKRYNFEVVAITGLSAGEPQPADIAKAVQAVREKHVTTIFVEPQLSSAAADRIAQATGAKVAVLDPLGTGDWFALMAKNLAALRAALVDAPQTAPTPSGAPAPASSTLSEPKR